MILFCKFQRLVEVLPVDDLVNVLNAKFLIVPIANPDNNQHAENENIRIKNFRDGIDMMRSMNELSYNVDEIM